MMENNLFEYSDVGTVFAVYVDPDLSFVFLMHKTASSVYIYI